MPLSRRARVILVSIFAVLIGIGTAVAIIAIRFQPVARKYVLSALHERYRSDVELGDLHISLFPSVHATGENLVLKSPLDHTTPLVTVKRFIFDARFIGFFRSPKRIHHIQLQGLQIHIPPKQDRKTGGAPPKIPFVLEEIVADGTTLETMPKDRSKDPLVFHIHQLTLHSVGPNRPMTFHAELENAKPPGLIHSDGEFGPWNADSPGESPINGKYTFRNADLSVFKGIRGTLSSEGDYHGRLENMEVKGTATVPDFALRMADKNAFLTTQFQATVDGTDGDTILHPVRARLGSSEFEVSGAIARGTLEKHKTILLESRGQNDKLEDFLRIVVRGPKPPMTGRLSYQTKVLIPPGDAEVIDRLQLDGAFTLAGIQFTSPDVEGKIASLSHRAQGEPESHGAQVEAAMNGHFKMQDGTLRLPDLRFKVPGALISLAGNYRLRSGEVSFAGTAKMDATISQMTTGFKSILLKPVDPLFKRNGAGAVLPIKIEGTRGKPSFKLDIGRVLGRK